MSDLDSENPDILELLPRLGDDDAGVRRIALIELADLEDPDGLPWLIRALGEDGADEVRAEAARLLEAWEEPAVVEGLCVALTDRDHKVRVAAAQSLSQLKTTQAGRDILPWAEHADVFVRSSALRALRELRLADSAPVALQALNDSQASVRREAVGILGWLKQTTALPELARLLRDDPDTEVRRVAAGALGFAHDESVLYALEAALGDQQWQVREEAATTLGKLGLPQAGPVLVAALGDEYWQVRLRAARSLGKLAYAGAVPALIELLGHSISNLRKEAALALGELHDPAAIPALQAVENDGDPEVRKAVRISLAQLRGVQA